jgi:hypothetical protein
MTLGERVKKLLVCKTILSLAYKAGVSCAVNGPNPSNCHFKFFATPELMQAWTRGKYEAKKRIRVCEKCRNHEHYACVNRRTCNCLTCEKIKADVEE